MAVLRAIGRFFARIGRWIRDTAWVQPLLIVGGIFAIIFSIPYLTNWVKSWFAEGDAATAYYEKNALSWKGVEDKKSQVDKLFQYLENPTAASEADKKKFGEKFFINFVQDGCEGCKSNYEGYKVLQNNWGKSEFKFEGEKETLKMFNIFIDKTNKDDKEYFLEYISGDKTTCRYGDFFAETAELKNHYMYNVGTGDDYHRTLCSSEDSFQSPITILIDFTFQGGAGYEIGEMGATEVFYTIAGKDDAGTGSDSSWAKARSIWDCWNHAGNFSANPDKK